MKIELSNSEIDNILKLMLFAVKLPESNDSFAEFYVFIKRKFMVQKAIADQENKVIEVKKPEKIKK